MFVILNRSFDIAVRVDQTVEHQTGDRNIGRQAGDKLGWVLNPPLHPEIAAARNQKDRGNNIKNDQEQGHALASIAALGARHVKAKVACNGKDILVPAPTHVHANDVIRWQGWRDFHYVTQCVRRFQRGNDPFCRATQLERL